MEQLIWFSVPGAVAVGALRLAYPEIRASDPALQIGLSVFLGFILHQLFRTIFELLGGWESRLRPVIKQITLRYRCTTSREAFLVWEITFYGSEIPGPFRDHDRGAWHYIMSFWSMSFAAVLAMLILFFKAPHELRWSPLFLAIIAIFFLKGWLTFVSIARQECKLFAQCQPAFDTVSRNLGHYVPNQSGLPAVAQSV